MVEKSNPIRDAAFLVAKRIRKSPVIRILIFVIVLTLISGGFFSWYEGVPFFKGVYWASDIFANLGTGIVQPQDDTTFWVAIILIWMGLGTTLKFVENVYKQVKIGEKKMVNYSNHVILLGWNRKMQYFVTHLSKSNLAQQNFVLLADIPKRPYGLPADIDFVQGDPQQTKDLLSINAEKAARAMIMMESDSDTIMTAMTLQAINEKVFITVNIQEEENIKLFKRIGIEDIVCDEVLAGSDILDSFNKCSGCS